MSKNMYRYFNENKIQTSDKHMSLTQQLLERCKLTTARYNFTTIRQAKKNVIDLTMNYL